MRRNLTAGEKEFSPDVNLLRYLQRIKRFPTLSCEEEYALAREYARTKDKRISARLINSHLRLVVKAVSAFRGYGLSTAELIAEGNMGLVRAVEKFDPNKGVRFSTYALCWVRAAVQKYVLSSWSLVKLGTTSAQKKIFFNLRKAKNKLNLNDDREMDFEVIRKLAMSFNVSEREIVSMNGRLSSHDASLNAPIGAFDREGEELQDFVVDASLNQEEKFLRAEISVKRKKMFSQALNALNPREKDILFKRRLSEKAATLEDLSKTYDISKERVRQIELNSIKKMRKAIDVFL